MTPRREDRARQALKPDEFEFLKKLDEAVMQDGRVLDERPISYEVRSCAYSLVEILLDLAREDPAERRDYMEDAIRWARLSLTHIETELQQED